MKQRSLTPTPAKSSFTPAQSGLLQCKCTACGQQAITSQPCPNCHQSQLLGQRSMRLAASHDPLEREADRIADQLMSRSTTATPNAAPLRVQRSAQSATVDAKIAPTSVDRALANPGTPLDTHLQQEMGQQFGYDFSKVRVHTDSVAAQSARSLNANAYTIGRDIVFRTGQFTPHTPTGRRLLAHELTHVVQQSQGRYQSAIANTIQRDIAPGISQANQVCYDDAIPQPDPPASRPEEHPTYERWLHSFTGLTTFRANDTAPGATARNRFRVLGAEGHPASRYGSTTSTPETEPVPTRGSARSGEEFIDHPTNQWVINCLPANLRATAYQLPADCADIAVILRHVWLAAHHRSETYSGWQVGDIAGQANQGRALRLIREVYSGNVDRMLNPYADDQGTPIRDFDRLADRLHPGDVLVWEHRRFNFDAQGRVTSSRRTGGHTQTITDIARSGSGQITAINVIQGNQPIFSDAATAILQHQGAATTDADSTAGRHLRNLPGRRIEASQAISIENIADPSTQQDVWGRDDGGNVFTFIVAAGPPRAARRPSARRGRRRSILDWRRAIARAHRRSIAGVLESLLQEARSLIEGGNPVADADMRTLGQRLGERLRTLLERRDVGQLLQKRDEFIAVIDALRDDANDIAAVTPLFEAFKAAFSVAAIPSTSTTESRRLYEESSEVGQFITPFVSHVEDLDRRLSRVSSPRRAAAIVGRAGESLWQAALDRAQIQGNLDDRPLYWTRLRMIEEIQEFASRRRLRRGLRRRLIDRFEQASRGQTTATFTGATATQRRILISGFDPFGLTGAPSGGQTDMTIQDSNPSAAAVLALDGQPVPALGSGPSAMIQGVIFPVRYRDFDAGAIEAFFGPFLRATPPVSMIMTISQGGRTFEIERWAGRRRSTDSAFLDNEGAWGGGTPSAPVEPPGIAAGSEFLETQLPHQAMTTVAGTHLDASRVPTSGAGPAVRGSGGGFLSNEIFYRVRLLQVNIGGNVMNLPVGHLHVPNEDIMTRQQIQQRVMEIIQAALPTLTI
ncbi:MAG: DUF4157 domain-containing protein [Cyanobacteria bacterium P01_H01_bin.152]